MSNSAPAPAWKRLEKLDLGELNDLNSDVFGARYDQSQKLTTTLSEVFTKHYSYDVASGDGPFAAVVLEVLSGPQVKNEATTDGRVNTTCLNIDQFPYPFFKDRKSANEKLPVVIKARIPEFDADMSWPKSELDWARIDAHGEFYQYRPDETLEKIAVGSIVWVSLNSKETVSINGRPSGKIVGIHTVNAIADILSRISAKKSMNPDCPTARNLSGPAGGLYVGHTDPDPNPNIGPPIRKIKGHIKTGIYGNGTPQTKAHFEAALEHAPNSFKHKIPGPAPGPRNAFIWVGTLKNNGYLDLLDRPLSQGRETIIYAPMTLDLTAPIEIKYYFHDKAGFGQAHLDGPNTTVDNAIDYGAYLEGNDFREKVAPGIKDLNKDGRNYILVIPEMAYSRGFGTLNNDISSIEALTRGEFSGLGRATGETIRTKVNANTRGAVKEYLSKLPIEANKNLLHVTPLREREFATFDGSFSGGKFEDFHHEVLDVLDEHLGTIYDKVADGFLSILADGLGGVALASILNSITVSSTHSEGRSSFKNAFNSKPVRIDYVTDELLDSADYYGYYFLGSPSYALYENFLLEHAEQAYTEFNYITSPGTNKNYFFDKIGKSGEYQKEASSTSGIGKKKFSFKIGHSTPGESFVSLHTAPEDTKTGYAFSMINTFLEDVRTLPKKPDANTYLKPAFNEVPDHHFALATKPSLSDLQKILKKQKELIPQINNFEHLIKTIAQGAGDSGADIACTMPEYMIYCNTGYLQTHRESVFFPNYKKYLRNKKAFAEMKLLAGAEKEIQKIINNRNELIKEKSRYESLLKSSKNTIRGGYGDAWRALNQSFSIMNFIGEDSYLGNNPDEGTLYMVAGLNAAPDAYQKIVTKLESAIKNASPEKIEKPEDCEEPPKKLEEVVDPPPPPVVTPGNNCEGIKISVPSNFTELSSMIPYFPKRSDFTFNGKKSKTKTEIHLVEGFKTSTFKYPARTANGEVTHKTSPPLWACITEMIKKAWTEACEGSKYYPFEITVGLRGSQDPKTTGTTAYVGGMSLHSYGLAFDLDPYIAGYARRTVPVYSVYTGAWTPGFVDVHGWALYNLGVYKFGPSMLKKNAYEADNRPRMTQNWLDAPSRYKGRGESGDAKEKYVRIMNSAKGGPIVSPGANPTLWLLLFCEKTGMRWGNGMFMKKRWKGGSRWSRAEKEKISQIFGIPDVVDRIRAISWKGGVEDHMHLHYWSGRSLVMWPDIIKVSKKVG